MIRRDTPKARADAILAAALTPRLKQNDFRKRGNVFARTVGHIVQMIDVQFARWNDTNEVSFTLNCGVYLPGVTSVFRNTPEPKQAKPTDCCVAARIGMLTEARVDTWWKLSVEDEAEKDSSVGQELEAILQRAALPFLSRFVEEKAIAGFLQEDRAAADVYVEPRADCVRFAYAAIIWSMLGERDKCQELVVQAINASVRTPLQEVVNAFAKRFAC